MIVERYAELLAATPNDLDRSHWTKELAEAIAAEPRIVQATIEQAFRSMQRGTSFVESRPVATFLPKTFGRRSEVLREGIIGLALVDHKAWELVEAEADDAVREFILLHQIAFFVRNNPVDPVGAIEDRALQALASDILFRTLELPRFKEEDADRTALVAETATEYLQALRSEIHDKDERISIGRALEAARQSGNKEEERRLLEAFARLTRGDASQNE